ncbi:MAG: hypothetical protein HC828_14440 [Blastochloris sp.]|nr:hypothetical protein [Blastochloris sp.]
MREFERQQPTLYQFIQDITPTIDTPDFSTRLADLWENIKPESLDYAVMENASDMVVIPANIGWSDVGSWDSLFSVLAADQNGNAIKGEADNQLLINTRNTLVYSEKLTVTIGLENIIIVDTDDVLMVCHKDNAQDVRQVVDQLRRAQRENYL